MRNVAVITLDSLRYDTTEIAHTPNFNRLFKQYADREKWVKVHTQGTYTLPSHIAMLHNGYFPNNRKEKFPYDNTEKSIFRVILPWERNKDAEFKLPSAPNAIKGFEKAGYRTVGIGGVGWFNTDFETSNLWKTEYFQEFYWQQAFHETERNSFANQIQFANMLNLKNSAPLCFFINVSSTHFPYAGFGIGNRRIEAQAKSLQYVDAFILHLLDLLPRPCYTIILSDHGECFGEDGLIGHGFYHPKVMEIPMIVLTLE